MANVNQNIEAIRAEVAAGNVEDRSFFNLKALGGEWSIKQGKKLTDVLQDVPSVQDRSHWRAANEEPEPAAIDDSPDIGDKFSRV